MKIEYDCTVCWITKKIECKELGEQTRRSSTRFMT